MPPLEPSPELNPASPAGPSLSSMSGFMSVVRTVGSLFSERTVRASVVSVLTDLLLASIKGVLALVTGSLALAADALHTLTDMVVSLSVMAGILVRRALNRLRHPKDGAVVTPHDPGPEDASQDPLESTAEPRAHGYWIEATVTAFVALFILYIPFEILSEVRNQPAEAGIRHAWIGVIGVLACIVIAYFASRFKIHIGRDADSPALEADGHHSRVDAFATGAVLLSLMGQFIGIDLDGLVAVVIAVLIGITGIDLLLSALVSLVRRANVQHMDLLDSLFSLADRLVGLASQLLLRRRLHLPRPDLSFLLRPQTALWVTGAGTGLWLASGLVVIPAGHEGARYRLGAVVETSLKPGLHYHLPAPIASIITVDTARLHRVEVGFRSAPPTEAKPADPAAVAAPSNPTDHPQGRIEEEALVLTGDEGIVELSLVVHYRIADAVTQRLRVGEPESVLRAVVEAAAREAVASLSSDRLLGDARPELAPRLQAVLEGEISRLRLGITLVAVHIYDLRPPLAVLPAFRDVFSARELKARLLAEADAHRNEALPKARAERARLLHEAESIALERRLHAQGDAQKFSQVAAAYRNAPEVTGYRLFIEAVENGLAGKEKVVADPEVNRGEYRYWLFAPSQPPRQAARSSSRSATRGTP